MFKKIRTYIKGILRLLTTTKVAQDDCHSQQGFSLIETLLGIFILVMITLSLYSLIDFSLKIMWESKTKIVATQLANQKIEMARNLSYEKVGTIGGIPNGIIPATETLTRDGTEFFVTTNVYYIDDPFDGTLGGIPDDTLNTDYKCIRVEVGWNYRLENKPIVFITNIAPPGLESAVGGGTLKILVYDALGQPVSQASVSITNNDTSPNIYINTQTDNQGYVILPGSPESVEAYQISVTKAGYSTDQTYSATTDLPSPEKSHASVFENQTTNISFAIDALADLEILVQDELGTPLSDISLDIQGQKTIGFDDDEKLVYKFDQTKNSNASGLITLNDIEWDTYKFSLSASSSYNIAETVPIQPLDILPGTTNQLTITLEPQATYSTLVIVKDVDGNPIDQAVVHYYGGGFDQTLTTDASGQVYFTPWTNAASTLNISKSGFENYTDEFEIDGYHVEQVIIIESSPSTPVAPF